MQSEQHTQHILISSFLHPFCLFSTVIHCHCGVVVYHIHFRSSSPVASHQLMTDDMLLCLLIPTYMNHSSVMFVSALISVHIVCSNRLSFLPSTRLPSCFIHNHPSPLHFSIFSFLLLSCLSLLNPLHPCPPSLRHPSPPPFASPRTGRGNLRPQLDSAMQDVSDLYLLMEETEKQAVRRALLEERGRYCTFINLLQPVVVRIVWPLYSWDL